MRRAGALPPALIVPPVAGAKPVFFRAILHYLARSISRARCRFDGRDQFVRLTFHSRKKVLVQVAEAARERLTFYA
jgi:hypothetical protein